MTKSNVLEKTVTFVKNALTIPGFSNQTDAVHAVTTVKIIYALRMVYVWIALMENMAAIAKQAVILNVKTVCATGTVAVFRAIMNTLMDLYVARIATIVYRVA